MQRRTFMLAPFALASSGVGCSLAHAAPANAPNTSKVAVAFSKLAVNGRPLWRDLDRMDPGSVSIEVDLWLRMDIDPPPAGGVLIKPKIRVIEDSISGRRPLLNSIELGGKSAPKSNEVHIVGKAEGLSHDDVFRPLGIEIGIFQAFVFNPGQQPGTTVSTIAGKDSIIVVTSK